MTHDLPFSCRSLVLMWLLAAKRHVVLIELCNAGGRCDMCASCLLKQITLLPLDMLGNELLVRTFLSHGNASAKVQELDQFCLRAEPLNNVKWAMGGVSADITQQG
jgi:hypothetical protein